MLAGCDTASNEEKKSEDVGEPYDISVHNPPPPIPLKPEGWTFCAKSGLFWDYPAEDCHLNENIVDKLSTCVYLNEIKFAGEAKSDIYYDHDELMTLLFDYSSYYDFCFLGNNKWPKGWLDECFHMSNHGVWEVTGNYGIEIIPHKDTWSAQIWFRQPPDLCWAVYETPCADEAGCK